MPTLKLEIGPADSPPFGRVPSFEIRSTKWFDKPFDRPFGRLTVLSKVEGLTVLSKVEGLTVLSSVEGLTTLSLVEGQIQNPNSQMFKT